MRADFTKQNVSSYFATLGAMDERMVATNATGAQFDLSEVMAAAMERAQAAHDAVYKRYRENYSEQLDWHKTGRAVPDV